MGYSKYDTKGKGKVKVKPTLYFTQEELDKLNKIRKHGQDWFITSMADFIENLVRDHLKKVNEK